MKEIWKDIEGYEGLYQVSNLGRVKSFPRIGTHARKIKIIKIMEDRIGYKYIHLSKNNKQKRKSIHRLVAETFIPNPNNYPCINHIDECKENNKANNLEWCTYSYNNNYGTKISRQREKIINNKKRSKPIIQYDLQKKYIKEYPSIREAYRQTKINYSCIEDCCRKKQKTAGGYIWEFK